MQRPLIRRQRRNAEFVFVCFEMRPQAVDRLTFGTKVIEFQIAIHDRVIELPNYFTGKTCAPILQKLQG